MVHKIKILIASRAVEQQNSTSSWRLCLTLAQTIRRRWKLSSKANEPCAAAQEEYKELLKNHCILSCLHMHTESVAYLAAACKMVICKSWILNCLSKLQQIQLSSQLGKVECWLKIKFNYALFKLCGLRMFSRNYLSKIAWLFALVFKTAYKFKADGNVLFI